MSSLHRYYAALLAARAAPLPALVQGFVHDSNSLVTYTNGWGRFPNAGNPFRNGDVVASGGTSQNLSIFLHFTSSGQPDEWLGCYGSLDASCLYQLVLNGVLIAERNATSGDTTYSSSVQLLGGGAFYYGGDLYANPFALFNPPSGANTLEIIKIAVGDNNSRNMFFDGFGYAFRGAPTP